MTLQEILAASNLNGDLEFADAAGNKFKLSDLRGLSTGLDAEKARLTAEIEKNVKLAKDAEGFIAALDKAVKDANAKAAPAAAPDTKKDAWKKNPLYEEIVPVVEALEATMKQAQQTASSATAQLNRMSAFYGLERLRSEYDKAPESYRKAKKFEDAVAEAIRNKDVVSFGEGDSRVEMPTLSKLIQSGTEQDRIDAAVNAALAKQKADYDLASRMNAGGAGKPGGSTKFSTRTAKEPPIKKLDDLTGDALMAEAAKDPNFARALDGEPV
jgi:hypothetical protein